nr:Chain BBB, CD44 antigen [Homo sapiens]
QKKKLVIN